MRAVSAGGTPIQINGRIDNIRLASVKITNPPLHMFADGDEPVDPDGHPRIPGAQPRQHGPDNELLGRICPEIFMIKHAVSHGSEAVADVPRVRRWPQSLDYAVAGADHHIRVGRSDGLHEPGKERQKNAKVISYPRQPVHRRSLNLMSIDGVADLFGVVNQRVDRGVGETFA